MPRVHAGGAARSVLLTLITAGLLFAVIGFPALPANAEVTAVQGSAYGYFTNVGLFGGPAESRGPAPQVTLASDASNSPQADSVPSAIAQYGPAEIFRSGQIDVTTSGSLGASGSVASSVIILGDPDPAARPDPLVYDEVNASCTATEAGTTASVTIPNGVVNAIDGPDGPPVSTPVPTNPTPGFTIEGVIETVNDNFRIVFNEQTLNADGSLTVIAAHMYLTGPTAVGEVIIGQVVCGVTATATTTTTTRPASTTTTTRPASTTTSPTTSTTTTSPGATTTVGSATTTQPTTTTAPSDSSDPAASTTPAVTTVAPATGSPDPSITLDTTRDSTGTQSAQTAQEATQGVGDISGGAFGFQAAVSLFGGPSNVRGPEPTITLPSGGASPAVTASAPSGSAVYGPAIVYESGEMTVSTEGTTGAAGFVSSTASAKNVGPAPFSADSVSSTCVSNASGQTASTTLAGGRLVVSQGADTEDESDDDVVELPANPAPNTSFEGAIEGVGDRFRVVLNEQDTSAGAITVNAVHMYLIGPIAVGDVIIGQSRCGATTTAIASTGGRSSATAGSTGARGQTALANTGLPLGPVAGLTMVLFVGGLVLVRTGRRHPTESS